MSGLRHLVVVLGDQLDPESVAFDGFDPEHDRVFMAEVAAEAEHVFSHRARIALFLAAMRHFREELRARGLQVEYVELAESTLGAELANSVRTLHPMKVIVVEPGEWRVREELRRAVPGSRSGPTGTFCARPRSSPSTPPGAGSCEWSSSTARCGGRPESSWRTGGPRAAPGTSTWRIAPPSAPRARVSCGRPRSFPPDPLTQEVLGLVDGRFPTHPGSLRQFDWPVTRAQARQALRDFVRHRLPRFGLRQDAMWTGEPYLYHSRLSAAMNLKLLDPREVIGEAERTGGPAPRRSRPSRASSGKCCGWREYVRGIYWLRMPAYLEGSALGADRPLPGFYWTGETEMACLREVIEQTLNHGYAHHIQRLMVTGLYALLLGVDPIEVHEWYLAIYVDAVEWVELPNVVGMSQYADGGLTASKPYVATGRYIQRMSNYRRRCRFDPAGRRVKAPAPSRRSTGTSCGVTGSCCGENPRMRMQAAAISTGWM